MGLRETGASGIADSKYKQLMENFCCKGKKRNKVVLEKKIESRVCALLLLLLLMLVLLQMGEILICQWPDGNFQLESWKKKSDDVRDKKINCNSKFLLEIGKKKYSLECSSCLRQQQRLFLNFQVREGGVQMQRGCSFRVASLRNPLLIAFYFSVK